MSNVPLPNCHDVIQRSKIIKGLLFLLSQVGPWSPVLSAYNETFSGFSLLRIQSLAPTRAEMNRSALYVAIFSSWIFLAISAQTVPSMGKFYCSADSCEKIICPSTPMCTFGILMVHPSYPCACCKICIGYLGISSSLTVNQLKIKFGFHFSRT